MDKEPLRILSIIPYKILPAKLGGEKGIAVFNEYLAKRVDLTGVTTKNNDPALAKGYRLLNYLSDNRSRYGNIFSKRRLLILSQNTRTMVGWHPCFERQQECHGLYTHTTSSICGRCRSDDGGGKL